MEAPQDTAAAGNAVSNPYFTTHQAFTSGHGQNRTYSIRQLAKEFEVTARALRFYEDKGLIHPIRKGQTRFYSARDRARLKLILRGKRMGFSLMEINEILDLYSRKDGGVTQMRASLAKYRAQIETLKQQRHDIDHALHEMNEGCAWMEAQLNKIDETI
jgi:DNA-binding transcriptional MerR regulator